MYCLETIIRFKTSFCFFCMEQIHKIAEHITNISQARAELASNLRKSSPEIISQIHELKINDLKVCGVDGGFLRKEFHGLTLLIRRAVGVCFSYSNIVEAKYLPSRNPQPEPLILTPEFSSEDINILSNLKRVEIELKTALDCVKEFKPSIILLDGSIVLHPSSVPKRNTAAYESYTQVILLFRELYKFCSDNQIMLAGTSEDSRSRNFCNVISKQLLSGKPEAKILDSANDTTFLHYLLKKGERTTHFSYSASGDMPGLSDLGEWRSKVYGMYIKPVEFDRPIRIDFLASNAQLQADKISAIVNAISCQNRTYAYPSVLIEADARAKLSEKDLGVFYKALREKLGMDPSLFELRRETRPI
jgi:hypothetical protein